MKYHVRVKKRMVERAEYISENPQFINIEAGIASTMVNVEWSVMKVLTVHHFNATFFDPTGSSSGVIETHLCSN